MNVHPNPSAYSDDLFGDDEMIGAWGGISGTDSFLQAVAVNAEEFVKVKVGLEGFVSRVESQRRKVSQRCYGEGTLNFLWCSGR